LDEVFVISRIIKVKVSVISLSQRLRLITPTETLIVSDVTKTESTVIIVLLNIVLKKITTNALSHRRQFIFDKACSYFAVRELDIGLGNHALHVQPTDYSLI